MDFSKTKAGTTEKLAGKEALLGSGEDIALLEPFAKAYLGLFLDIDAHLEPGERIALLTSPELAQCILRGFEAALRRKDFPGPREIGQAMAAGERIPMGFVALAGIDHMHRRSPQETLALPRDTLSSTLCFHYANKIELAEHWTQDLLEHYPEMSTETLLEFWLGMIDKGTRYLPGLMHMLRDQDVRGPLSMALLILLESWAACGKKQLLELIRFALCYSDNEELYEIAGKMLSLDDMHDVAIRTYWMGARFLVHPGRHQEEMFDYVGRTREKAIPLMNLLVPLLVEGMPCRKTLPVQSLGWLMHMLAPKIAPHIDQFGRMEENATKIVQLFDLFKQYPAEEALAEIRRLRSIRVMRVYSQYLDELVREIGTD